MANVYQLGRTLSPDHTDKNADKNSFCSTKALNMAIHGGPKSEPLTRDMNMCGEDWNECNDIKKPTSAS